jgi:hypothetical protein
MSSKMRNYPPFAGKKMHFFTFVTGKGVHFSFSPFLSHHLPHSKPTDIAAPEIPTVSSAPITFHSTRPLKFPQANKGKPIKIAQRMPKKTASSGIFFLSRVITVGRSVEARRVPYKRNR